MDGKKIKELEERLTEAHGRIAMLERDLAEAKRTQRAVTGELYRERGRVIAVRRQFGVVEEMSFTVGLQHLFMRDMAEREEHLKFAMLDGFRQILHGCSGVESIARELQEAARERLTETNGGDNNQNADAHSAKKGTKL